MDERKKSRKRKERGKMVGGVAEIEERNEGWRGKLEGKGWM